MKRLALAILLVALFAALPAADAQIIIVNADGAGEGFNDPTPVAPVGLNTGTTLGEQRLLAFQAAADVWSDVLQVNGPVEVFSAFNPLTCGPTGAVLGSAGSLVIFSDFANAPLPGTWFHGSVANSLSQSDLDPASPEIIAQFNSDIDNACLPGASGWYYGLDEFPPAGTLDFFPVLLHELGHGLGFANFVNENVGSFPGPPVQEDIFSVYTRDETTGETWAQMDNDGDRVASALRCNDITWSGPKATAAAQDFLSGSPGTPRLQVSAPGNIAGDYRAGGPGFGPALTAGGVTGTFEIVDDGTGTTTDACEPLVGFTAGNIAFVDRGNCAFTDKVMNAEAAGAIAVIVADNVSGCPPPNLGGAAVGINIPSVRISLEDGNAIRAEIPGATGTVGLDGATLAGLHPVSARPLLFASDPVQLGSSISHWDNIASPDLLMEPFAVTFGDALDITPDQLCDIGWLLGGGVPVQEIPVLSWQGLLALAALLLGAAWVLLRRPRTAT